MENSKELTPIQSFYKGKTIFITGASGFMGKVLLEKLLYTCSELKEILILVRPKRNKIPQSRLDDMFKIPMFQRIRDEKPEVLKKVVAIQGDLTFDNLGLSGEVEDKIVKSTNIVFNCAATLRLEAKLKDAVEMNTSGTNRVLNVCKKMTNLEVVVHLSTAFCYCDKDVLDEKVYDCPYQPRDIMRCAEWMDEKTLDAITPNLLKPHPNTYTFTKRLTEILVRDAYGDLPICIARPSIVCPAYREPLAGWVDSLNGPIGVMVGGAKGVIRSMLCDGTLRSESIPVDIAIAGLLLIAEAVGTLKEKPKNIPVYNLSVTESKKLTWGEVLERGKAIAYEYPFEAGAWYPNGIITTNRLVHSLNLIFFHWLPAYLIDFLMLCCGQKRFMCHVQRRISDGLDVLQFFTTRAWDFRSENFFKLYPRLNEIDKKLFDLDTDSIDTDDYLFKTILGGRQYCLKEPLSTLPKARLQLKALYVLDRVCKILLFGLFVWLIWKYTGIKALFGK